MPLIPSGGLLRIGYSGEIYGKYRGKAGAGKKHGKTVIHDLNPIIFVMWWDNELVHGINLKYFDNKSLVEFFNIILGKKLTRLDYYRTPGSTREIKIPNARQYYNDVIAPFLGKRNINAYRTYKPGKIHSIRRMNIREVMRGCRMSIASLPKK